MSEDSLTTLMLVTIVLMLAWVPVAAITGKRSGASFTIFAEAMIILAIIIFELIRRAWKC
jgi:hypothetical protein